MRYHLAAVLMFGSAAGLGGAGREESKVPHVLVEAKLRTMYQSGLGEIRYFAGSFDLNDDGRDEIIAHIAGPMVCGTGGCDTMIFGQDADSLQLISAIAITRPPIRVGNTKSNGWRDLIVFVSAGGILPGYNARLRFDGVTYPENPTVEPAQRVTGSPAGRVVINRFRMFTEGRLLRAGAE